AEDELYQVVQVLIVEDVVQEEEELVLEVVVVVLEGKLADYVIGYIAAQFFCEFCYCCFYYINCQQGWMNLIDSEVEFEFEFEMMVSIIESELDFGFRTEILKVEEIANFVSKFGFIIEIVVVTTTFTSFVITEPANVITRIVLRIVRKAQSNYFTSSAAHIIIIAVDQCKLDFIDIAVNITITIMPLEQRELSLKMKHLE
ncbi:MAG: hypothetical protein EZS28_052753, partial [Streblomastix strix]